MAENGIKAEDTFQILLATDCHLGYMERDAIRGSDSLVTFEEILNIAVEKNVDFILLGGDLFHENKPSRKVMHQCMHLLRKYCTGDRPIQFEFLSDQSENFKHSAIPIVNYEDPNLNISFPVFSIHGNHDDPAGAGGFCTIDLLSISGLVNYFGKCVDLESVRISPVLLQKGCTKLALYGLGSIRDERLHRLFCEERVSMLKHCEKAEEWFSILVLHQNRTKHGPKNYIPETFLDDFLDLVFWGHEHECRIIEEWNTQKSFYVTQPGSSIATSLCHGEAVPKHVGLLQIHKKTFKITEIALKTVRQFYIKDVDLEEISINLNEPDCTEKVSDYLKELVEEFLQNAAGERSGHPKQPDKPLIRLRVYYPENFDTFSVQRFGQSFVDRVANSKDIILFSRKKLEKDKTSAIDKEALKSVLMQEGIDKSRVEDLVKQYFQQAEENKQLSLLSENGIGNAVQEYVDKEVGEAITVLVEHQLRKVQDFLKEKQANEDQIEDEIDNFRKQRQQNSSQELKEFQDALKGVNLSSTSAIQRNQSRDKFFDDDFDDTTMEIAMPKTRGRGRGRGSRGGRGRGVNKSPTSASNAESKPSSRASRSSSKTAENAQLCARRGYGDSTWKASGKQKSISNNFGNDSELISIDDSDDDGSVKKQPKKKHVSRRGVMYDDDSDSPF